MSYSRYNDDVDPLSNIISMTFITMSQTQLDRYDILKRLIHQDMNGTEASHLLGLTVRHVRRLKGAVKQHGANALVHALKGRPSNRKLPQAIHDRIVKVIKNHYADFGPTLAQEKLSEQHRLSYDVGTIRSIMIAQGLWKPKKGPTSSEHRQWRLRRSFLGELVQFDGSYEFWFEDRSGKCCLLAAIDDATGKILSARFGAHEGIEPVFGFWKDYLLQHGRPRAIYMDKFSTYKMNSKFAQENHELKTQFQRVCDQLQIEPIFAHSPQAKGRVERLFQTLQDRLIKELRLQKIFTINAGNRFLEETFIPWFNQKFAVEPSQSGDLHRALTAKEKQNLDSVFSRQYERTVHNDFTLSYKNQWYQLTKDQPATVCKKDVVTVEERLDGSVWIRLRGKYLRYTSLPERPKKAVTFWVIPKVRVPWKPPVDHPWRHYAVRVNAVATAPS